MRVFRRRLMQGLAVLGALTVLAAVGWGIYFGVDQVRRYIAVQDAQIAHLTYRLDAQLIHINQQRERLAAQADRLAFAQADTTRLRDGLGTLQLRTANQHSRIQFDVADLQNNLGALREFTTDLQTDTVFDVASLRYTFALVERDLERVETEAIDADVVHDQRLDAANFELRAVDTRVERIEGLQSDAAIDRADLAVDLANLKASTDRLGDRLPSERIAAGLLPAWLLMLSTEWGGHLGEYVQAETVRVQWSANLADDVAGDYNAQTHLVRVDEDLRGERPELLAAILAHEFWHAVSDIPRPRTYAKCIEDEMHASIYEAVVWDAFNLTPRTDAERGRQSILDNARRLRPADDTLPVAQWTAFRAYVEDGRGYREWCSR